MALQRRLEWDGLSPDAMDDCLRPVELSESAALPTWADVVRTIMVAASGESSIPLEDHAAVSVPFGPVFAPHLKAAKARLNRQGRAITGRMPDAMMEGLCASLVTRLSQAAAPCLRSLFAAEKALANSGFGSGRQRFDAFCTWAVSPEGLHAIFDRFPVLARITGTLVADWVDAAEKLAERYSRDRSSILNHFPQTAHTRLESVAAGLSDPHEGGQTVVEFRYENGFVLYYKPRDGRSEAAFQEVLSWLNGEYIEGLPGFPTLNILERQDYCWVGEIAHEPAGTAEECARAYRRAGAYLCLFTLFGTTDMHGGNFVAKGEDLVPVDLETLCPPKQPPRRRTGEHGAAARASWAFWADTVLGPMFLPDWSRDPDGNLFDITGLGGVDDGPVQAIEWRHVNSDEMVRQKVTRPQRRQKNGVFLDGEICKPSSYTDEIVSGFSALYRHLEHHRARFEDLPAVQAILTASNRYLYRDTNVYSRLLDRLSSPALMQDGVAFGLELEKLYRAELAGRADRPASWPLAGAEIQSLLRRDVPVFRTCEANTVLRVGTIRIPDLFPESPAQSFARRLERLGAEDRLFQTGLIRARLLRAPAGRDTSSARDRTFREDFRDEIFEIADWHLHTALSIHGRGQSWSGPEDRDPTGAVLRPPGLYSGSTGIILVLAAAAGLQSDTGRRSAYRDTILKVLAVPANGGDGMSLASGAAGLLYSLSVLARLLPSDFAFFRDLTVELLGSLPEEMASDFDGPDLLHGVGGMIAALDACRLVFGGGDLQRRMKALLPVLVSAVSRKSRPDSIPCGFGHGWTGIAHALHRSRGLLETEILEQAVAGCLAADRVTGDTDRWCSGATGRVLGLSRIAVDGGDAQVGRELDQVLRTVIDAPANTVDHLCCGNLGRAACLHSAGVTLQRDDIAALGVDRGGEILARCGGPFGLDFGHGHGVTTLGFFQGIAGVGYALARFTEPAAIPDVLSLE
ncbi:type 2 lanthipeptide synthetase LanM family protein [Nisaea sp.]|uniref:type 2 lanthipeptide synthetase LanM family protein n=1 Tax=Nisaea sp. TaxID=2024842 RepID=UPI0032EAD652